MSRLDKLRIRGIRSFHPENSGVIQFFTPLTIIVGHNGAGKTTIIECLKQACTGDLPPNVKSGQAFIHDPKIAGDTETKAQIVLRIRDTADEFLVVKRSFELVQASTKMQFKTLDVTTEELDDAGQKVHSSHKVADVDELVPRKLGVTKAVLDNVIFVHQEESNWPLGELKTVKAKFEAIFESSRYVKAMETIRKLKNEKNAELKFQKSELAGAETKVGIVKRLRGEVEADEKEVAGAREKIQRIDDEHAARKADLDRVKGRLNAFDSSFEQLAGIEAKLAMVKKRTAEMYDALDQELEEELEEIQKYQREQEAEKPQLRQKIDALEEDLYLAREALAQHESTHGEAATKTSELKAEIKLLASDTKSLFKDTRHLFRKHQLPTDGITGDIPDLYGAFTDTAATVVDKFDSTKQAHQELLEKNAGAKDRLKEEGQEEGIKYAQFRDSIATKQVELSDLKKEATGLKGELQQFETELATIEEMATKEEGAKAAMDAAQETFSKADFDDAIEGKGADLKAGEEKAAGLRKERDELQAVAQEQMLFEAKQEEIEKKDGEIQGLLGAFRGDIAAALGTDGAPATEELEGLFEEAVGRQEAAVRDAQKAATAASAQQAAASQRVAAAQKQWEEVSAVEIKSDAKSREEHAQALEKAQQEYMTCQSALAQLEFSGRFAKQCLVHSEKHSACAVCDGKLSDAARLDAFKVKQKRVLEEVPKRVATARKRVKVSEEDYLQVRDLMPSEAQMADLAKKRVAAAGEVDAAKAALAAAEKAAGAQDAQLAAEQEKLPQLQGLQQKAAWPIARLGKELAALRAALPAAPAGASGRTLKACQKDLKEAEEGVEQCRRALNELREAQAAGKEEVLAAERRWRDCREAALKAQDAAQSCKSQKAALAAVAGKISALEAAIAELKSQKKDKEKAHAAGKKERKAQEDAMAAEEKALEKTVDEFEGHMKRLQNAQDRLTRYLKGHIKTELDGLEAENAGFKKEKDVLQAKVLDLEEEKSDVSKQLSKNEGTTKLVYENIAYRKSKEEEEKLERELAGLGEAVRQKEEVEGLKEEQASLEGEIAGLLQQRNIYRGSSMAVQDRINGNKKELKKKVNVDAEEEFDQCKASVKVHEEAIADLDKYYKAIDKALVEYHEERMTEVNWIIKDLWRKTYKSSDIDYIFIKATAEGSRGSYNYRVMMVTGGAELDMRGRCSAGQKVLACIIIRLALSEAFCIKCGVLALDEPTTNVDKENSRALATVLQNIIEMRSSQNKHFQLIVITHDEEFAQCLGRKEFCEHYWLVQKNENQCSEVLRQMII